MMVHLLPSMSSWDSSNGVSGYHGIPQSNISPSRTSSNDRTGFAVVVHIRAVPSYEAVSTTSDDTLEADFNHIFDIQPVGKESQKRPQHYVQMCFTIAQEKCT